MEVAVGPTLSEDTDSYTGRTVSIFRNAAMDFIRFVPMSLGSPSEVSSGDPEVLVKLESGPA